MRFGLIISKQHPAGASMVERFREHVDQVRAARDAGFDMIVMGQHYLSTPFQELQTLPSLARLAAEAGTMRIGATVLLLPLLNPVDVAEQVATLDVICEGRFVFGAGLGYRDQEYEAFGIQGKERVGRFVESLEVIRRLWTEDGVTFHGKFFHLDKVSMAPKPLQRPGPPILLGADSVKTVARVPEVADHWIASRRHSKTFLREAVPAYKTALERHGRPYKGLFIFRDLCIADSTREAEQRIREGYERRYLRYQQWGQPGERYDLKFEELKRDRLILGSPSEVVEQVMAYHEEFGAEVMWFMVDWPGMDPRFTLETIERFGAEVIPQINRLTRPCPLL